MALDYPRHPWIKLDCAPVFLLGYPTGQEKGYFEDLGKMYAVLLAWLKSTPCRHVTIADLRRLKSTAKGRQMATDFYTQTVAFEGRYLLGCAYVTAGEQNRHAITAVSWGAGSGIPKVFFDNPQEAIVWAQARINER